MVARVALALLACFAATRGSASDDGETLYDRHCASCHEATAQTRAPDRSVLRALSPERIMNVLEGGSMALLGLQRTPSERRALAGFLSSKAFGSEPIVVPAPSALCEASARPWGNPLSAPGWNGWGVTPANTRFQDSVAAGLSASEVPRLKLKWAFGFPGEVSASAQPVVVGGRVFVGTYGRVLYALDASSGCILWTLETSAGVRSAVTVGATGNGLVAYFGDLNANVYAVDAERGKLLWKVQVDGHPAARVTGSPKLHEGRLYVPVSSVEEVSGGAPTYACCTFRGSLVALDASSGNLLWKSPTIPEVARPTRKNAVGTQLWGPSGAAVWASPTLDLKRKVIYVTTGDSYSDPAAATSDSIMAFEMKSGKRLWSRQMTANDAYNLACNPGTDPANCPQAKGPDLDFGSSPILVELGRGRRALVAGQKSGVVHAVDPDRKGAILWQERIGKGSTLGGIQWGSAADGEKVYAALSDISFTAEGPDPLAGGGMFALDLAKGTRVWSTPPPGCSDRRPCSPAQMAAVSGMPGVVFSGSRDGHLRGYSTDDGRIVWDFDTVREYATVNGVAAKGGAIDGGGVAIADGLLFSHSGYGLFGGIPGNVLLAFSVDGK